MQKSVKRDFGFHGNGSGYHGNQNTFDNSKSLFGLLHETLDRSTLIYSYIIEKLYSGFHGNKNFEEKKSKVANILKITLPRCYPKDLVRHSQIICPQLAKLQNSAKVFIVSITTGHVTSGAHGRNIFPWSTIKTLHTEIRWKLSLYKAIEIVLTEA